MKVIFSNKFARDLRTPTEIFLCGWEYNEPAHEGKPFKDLRFKELRTLWNDSTKVAKFELSGFEVPESQLQPDFKNHFITNINVYYGYGDRTGQADLAFTLVSDEGLPAPISELSLTGTNLVELPVLSILEGLGVDDIPAVLVNDKKNVDNDFDFLEGAWKGVKNLLKVTKEEDSVVTKDSYYRFLRGKAASEGSKTGRCLDEVGKYQNSYFRFKTYREDTLRAVIFNAVGIEGEILTKYGLATTGGYVQVGGTVEYDEWEVGKDGLVTKIGSGLAEISGVDGVTVVCERSSGNFDYQIDNVLNRILYGAGDSVPSPWGIFHVEITYLTYPDRKPHKLISNSFRLVQGDFAAYLRIPQESYHGVDTPYGRSTEYFEDAPEVPVFLFESKKYSQEHHFSVEISCSDDITEENLQITSTSTSDLNYLATIFTIDLVGFDKIPEKNLYYASYRIKPMGDNNGSTPLPAKRGNFSIIPYQISVTNTLTRFKPVTLYAVQDIESTGLNAYNSKGEIISDVLLEWDETEKDIALGPEDGSVVSYWLADKIPSGVSVSDKTGVINYSPGKPFSSANKITISVSETNLSTSLSKEYGQVRFIKTRENPENNPLTGWRSIMGKAFEVLKVTKKPAPKTIFLGFQDFHVDRVGVTPLQVSSNSDFYFKFVPNTNLEEDGDEDIFVKELYNDYSENSFQYRYAGQAEVAKKIRKLLLTEPSKVFDIFCKDAERIDDTVQVVRNVESLPKLYTLKFQTKYFDSVILRQLANLGHLEISLDRNFTDPKVINVGVWIQPPTLSESGNETGNIYKEFDIDTKTSQELLFDLVPKALLEHWDSDINNHALVFIPPTFMSANTKVILKSNTSFLVLRNSNWDYGAEDYKYEQKDVPYPTVKNANISIKEDNAISVRSQYSTSSDKYFNSIEKGNYTEVYLLFPEFNEEGDLVGFLLNAAVDDFSEYPQIPTAIGLCFTSLMEMMGGVVNAEYNMKFIEFLRLPARPVPSYLYFLNSFSKTYKPSGWKGDFLDESGASTGRIANNGDGSYSTSVLYRSTLSPAETRFVMKSDMIDWYKTEKLSSCVTELDVFVSPLRDTIIGKDYKFEFFDWESARKNNKVLTSINEIERAYSRSLVKVDMRCSGNITDVPMPCKLGTFDLIFRPLNRITTGFSFPLNPFGYSNQGGEATLSYLGETYPRYVYPEHSGTIVKSTAVLDNYPPREDLPQYCTLNGKLVSGDEFYYEVLYKLIVPHIKRKWPGLESLLGYFESSRISSSALIDKAGLIPFFLKLYTVKLSVSYYYDFAKDTTEIQSDSVVFPFMNVSSTPVNINIYYDNPNFTVGVSGRKQFIKTPSEIGGASTEEIKNTERIIALYNIQTSKKLVGSSGNMIAFNALTLTPPPSRSKIVGDYRDAIDRATLLDLSKDRVDSAVFYASVYKQPTQHDPDTAGYKSFTLKPVVKGHSTGLVINDKAVVVGSGHAPISFFPERVTSSITNVFIQCNVMRLADCSLLGWKDIVVESVDGVAAFDSNGVLNFYFGQSQVDRDIKFTIYYENPEDHIRDSVTYLIQQEGFTPKISPTSFNTINFLSDGTMVWEKNAPLDPTEAFVNFKSNCDPISVKENVTSGIPGFKTTPLNKTESSLDMISYTLDLRDLSRNSGNKLRTGTLELYSPGSNGDTLLSGINYCQGYYGVQLEGLFPEEYGVENVVTLGINNSFEKTFLVKHCSFEKYPGISDFVKEVFSVDKDSFLGKFTAETTICVPGTWTKDVMNTSHGLPKVKLLDSVPETTLSINLREFDFVGTIRFIITLKVVIDDFKTARGLTYAKSSNTSKTDTFEIYCEAIKNK